MKDIAPPRLYKYQPLYNYELGNERTLQNLKNRVLWFSNPEDFNDPFDSQINFILSDINEDLLKHVFEQVRQSASDKQALDAKYLTNGQINSKFRDIFTEQMKNVPNQIKNILSPLGVACFSECNNSILMWSHYANGHQGICLEFDTKYPPFSRVDKNHGLKKVEYPKENLFPLISVSDVILKKTFPQWLRRLFAIKSFHWTYEQEWRVFSKKNNIAFTYDKTALTGVYLGCKTLSTYKKAIASILVGSQTTLYQMVKSNNEFGLKYQALEYAP